MLTEESYKELKAYLESCDKAYYVTGNPFIPDVEYDRKKKELEAYEKEHGIEPKVSSDLTPASRRLKHPSPMLSLANTYNTNDVRTFVEKVLQILVDSGCAEAPTQAHLCIEPKIDGLSIEVYYDETGAFCRALTRGDGEYGDDVTENVRMIEDIPKTMPYGPVIVRGEIYMPRSQFDKLKKEGKAPKDANCRNFAVGSLKQKDPKVTAERGLSAFFYDIVAAPCLDHIDTQATMLAYMHLRMGLPTQLYFQVTMLLDKTIEETLNDFDQYRADLDYDTDGAVLKVNELKYRPHLGSTAKAPRWAFAYKFNPDMRGTTILSIDFQVGRTGRIVPVANITPVILSGAKISRVSIGSVGTMKRFGLNSGSSVTVVRSGEVVPKIIAVNNHVPPFDVDSYLKQCPVCGSSTKPGPGGEEYFCTNPSCPPRLIARLLHFCSREAGLDIEGVGNTVAEVLVNTGVIRHFTDILTVPVETLRSVKNPENGRVLGKVADKIVATRDLSKKPFWRIISSLGIEGLGVAAAKMIAERSSNFDDFINNANDTKEEILLAQWICSDEGEIVVEKFKNLLVNH